MRGQSQGCHRSVDRGTCRQGIELRNNRDRSADVVQQDGRQHRRGRFKFSLDEKDVPVVDRDERLLEIDQALARLESLDERAAKVVELRYFGGLSEKEAAEALGISVATLKRDWEFARTWL